MLQILALICIILQILDGVTTYFGITSGKGKEDNKLLAWFIKRFGLIPTLMVAKSFGIIVAGLLYQVNSILGLLLVVAFYAVIVAKNYRLLK